MNTDPARKPQGIGEFLFNELRQAIRDVRQKLVDEGWFGRRSSSNTQADGVTFDLNPRSEAMDRFYGKEPSFEERWAIAQPAPEKPAQERGIGIDR